MRVQCPGCDSELRIPAADEGRKVECPDCGEVFRARAPDEDEDDAPRRKKGKKKATAGTNAQVYQIAGGTAAAVLAIGAVVYVIASRPKADKPEAAPAGGAALLAKGEPDRGKAFLPANADVNFGGGRQNQVGQAPFQPGPNGLGQANPGGRPVMADTLGELFRQPVSVAPPKVRLAGLGRKDGEPALDVPTFHSLKLARAKGTPPVPKDAKLTLDEVKKATAYIVVKTGDPNKLGSQGNTGSGFLIGAVDGSGLVATNHHVIKAALVRPAPGAPAPTITVVFNSGAPGEFSLPARVTAIDPIADLAVLRVPGGRLPKPINPWAAVAPAETMDVNICGFPLGEILTFGNSKHPNISISGGSISSLRTAAGGKLERVQITGPIIPGNSGGPIVDKKDGRLVGIAVAQAKDLRATALGFAVPVDDLIALIEGKLLVTALVPTGMEGTQAKFKVVVPVMDPFSRVKTVYLRYWAGDGPRPKAVKDRLIGHQPIKPAEQIALPVVEGPTSLSIAVGELRLPTDVPEVVLQVASEVETDAGTRMTAAGPPVTFAVKVDDQPSGHDARPFAELLRDTASRAGEVVVVRGKVMSPPDSLGPVQDLVVADLAGKVPAGIRFVTSRELSYQFDEIDAEQQGLDARLTCVIGTRGADGVVPVRVARVDFLEDGNRVVRSIPAADPGEGLAALNRDPGRFAGQSLELKATALMGLRPPAGSEDLFLVLFPNMHMPRNLQFVTAPGLTRRLADEEVAGIPKVRLSVTVGQVTGEGTPTRVVVRKIQILDPKDDSVVVTIE